MKPPLIRPLRYFSQTTSVFPRSPPLTIAVEAHLQSSTAHNATAATAVGGGAPAGKKTIKGTYQKKTQLEHILLRPHTYFGPVEKHTQTLWVYEGGEMVHRPISYVPGLYKIFDEILINAADNKPREPSMDTVKVDIDPEANCISVYNKGQA